MIGCGLPKGATNYSLVCITQIHKGKGGPMSRFLHNKLTVIAVVMLAVILVSGAAWAATSNQAEDFAPSLQTFPVQVLISEADADSPGVLLEDLNIAGPASNPAPWFSLRLSSRMGALLDWEAPGLMEPGLSLRRSSRCRRLQSCCKAMSTPSWWRVEKVAWISRLARQ